MLKVFPFRFPYTGLKSPNMPQYVKHRGGQRQLDKSIFLFLFKWSDSDRQGGPAPPEYLPRKHCNFESFQKKEIGDTDCIYCMLNFCSLSIFQSLFLKAQSVYTWIRISLNGIVPPFPFCFVLFIIMATDPSDVFLFTPPISYTVKFLTFIVPSIAACTFSWFWSQEAPRPPGWPHQTHS